VGPGNRILDGGPDPPWEGTIFLGGGVYSDTLQRPVQKQLNRSICRLGCELGWAEGSTISIVFARRHQCALPCGHIGATWRIRLNRPVCGDDAVLRQITLTTRFYSAPQCSHCNCKRCTSYSNSVCLSVRLSVCPSVRPSVCHTPVLCQNHGT